jgi:2',3'-cyclic-nucleotide 2'-phosphodiesterase (5'-nucleotidase family)
MSRVVAQPAPKLVPGGLALRQTLAQPVDSLYSTAMMIDRLCAVLLFSVSFAFASQPTAPRPEKAPLRDLTWGQLNFLHTTDTHGWHAGHLQEYESFKTLPVQDPQTDRYSDPHSLQTGATTSLLQRVCARGPKLMVKIC